MKSNSDFVPQKYTQNDIKSGKFQWTAPSNIALVKYWGKKENQIPANPSISFTLNNCKTITTLEFEPKKFKDDNFTFDLFFEGILKEDFKPEFIRVYNNKTDIQNRKLRKKGAVLLFMQMDDGKYYKIMNREDKDNNEYRNMSLELSDVVFVKIKEELEIIANKICDILDNIEDTTRHAKNNKELEDLASNFVIYNKSTF